MDGQVLRLIEQLQREVKELKQQLASQRARAYGSLNPSQAVIVQYPSGGVDGRVADGDEFDVNYTTCNVWDLHIDNSDSTTGTFRMKKVEPGTGSRLMVVANPWAGDVEGSAFGVAIPYKGILLPVAEECEVAE